MNNWREKLMRYDITFFCSLYFQLLLFSIYSIAVISFFTGNSISSFYFPIALIICNVIFFYQVRKKVRLSTAILLLIFVNLILAIAFLISINFIDTSYDGQWYHQPAIIKLAEGWNPFYDPFYTINHYEQNNYLWIQHYSKASWIMAACIYKTTGLIESGKLINFIAIAAVFFYAYSFFVKLFKEKIFIAFFFSLLISLNPVATSQLLSDYNDGILCNMQCVLLLSLFDMQLFHNRQFIKWKWFVLLSAIIIAANLKFSGLFISGIIVVIFSFYWWWKKESPKIIFRRYALIGITAIFAIALYGFNPYGTNSLYKGYIFYPLNVKEDYHVLIGREPDAIKDKNNIEKFFISIFSSASNDPRIKEINWKNPIQVTRHDLRIFEETDVKIGGFGPLFLLGLLLSFLLGAFFFGELKKEHKVLFIVSFSAIFLSAILVPSAWKTRYVSHFFLLPVLICVFSFYLYGDKKNSIKKYLSIGLLIILTLNFLLIAKSNISANLYRTRLIKDEINTLKLRKDKLMMNFSKAKFQVVRTRLNEAGVHFTESDTLTTNVQEFRVLYDLNGFGPMYNKTN